MSKYSVDQVMAEAHRLVMCGQLDAASMLHEYAAHLAQPEWPSDAVDKVWAKLVSPATPSAVRRTSITKEDMRAALQSVRPPGGVVSDEDVAALKVALFPCLENVKHWQIREALKSYASRHAPTAPTKD